MKIWKEKAGIISKDPVWCCAHDYYLYIEDNIPMLIWTILTQWKAKQHFIGF